jgi:hypothetical protein
MDGQRAYWFAALAAILAFRPGPPHLAVHRPPRAHASGFILSEFAPLQSPAVTSPPHASRCGAPSMGLRWPSSRHNRQRPHGGLPGPPLSVLDVSHVLDGLLRCRPCGFVSPHSHVQGSALQGIPLARSRLTSSVKRALSSLARHRYQQLPTGATMPCPALRAFLRVRVRDRCASVTRRIGSVPSWASPPPGSPSPCRGCAVNASCHSWS